jgi:hypothetical protein
MPPGASVVAAEAEAGNSGLTAALVRLSATLPDVAEPAAALPVLQGGGVDAFPPKA